MSALHITNGDEVAAKLRTFAGGDVIPVVDVLYEGPAPPIEGPAWYDVRARYLASAGYARYDDARQRLTDCDEIVDSAARYDEVVLWFEHDLFDQLLLVRTLDRLAAALPARGDAAGARPRLSLICIGEFPGVDRFVGLGQLPAPALASLVPTRHEVTAAEYDVAVLAWHAFVLPSPIGLLALDGRTAALPFLGEAMRRFCAEYPSTDNGLTLTEQYVLEALAAQPLTGAELFVRAQRQEARPFMGDTNLYRVVRALAAARVPLVSIGDDTDRTLDLQTCEIAITEAGGSVLGGRADAIHLNGIDTWRGGVALAGSDAAWRWDRRAGTLVSWP